MANSRHTTVAASEIRNLAWNVISPGCGCRPHSGTRKSSSRRSMAGHASGFELLVNAIIRDCGEFRPRRCRSSSPRHLRLYEEPYERLLLSLIRKGERSDRREPGTAVRMI